MEREWQEESLEAGLAAEAPAAGQTVDVHAPQGPLGLVFQRHSTVLSRIKDSSPLLHKVQVGWTLVSVDGQDVSRMDGWAVTKEISARMHDPDGRRLKFKTDEAVAAGEALPAKAAGEALPAKAAGEVLPAAEPAAAKSPRLGFWAAGMAAAAGARARTSIEEQPVDGEVVTSPTSSENVVVDAEALDLGETAQTVGINVPQGPLGLIFELESTVLSKVRETSPLYGRVEAGWMLVAFDGEDVSHLDASRVTKLLKMRSHNPQGRRLEFKAPSKEELLAARAWEVCSGRWKLGPVGSGPHVVRGHEVAMHALFGAVAARDYEFEAGVTLLSNAFCGLIFRAQSPFEYYVFYASYPGPKAKFELWRHTRGGWGSRSPICLNIRPQGGVSYRKNKRFVMRIVVRGSQFMLYVDGVLQAKFTDKTYTHGKVGLWAWESDARFDSIKLDGVPLKVSVPLQAVTAGEVEAKAVELASPAPDLTEEQRAALVAFAEIDADGDGELSADEIHRALSKNNEDVSLDRVKELVAKADKSGDGLVSKQEYLDAIAADLVPEGWLGFFGRQLARLAASSAEPEPAGTISIDAPPGMVADAAPTTGEDEVLPEVKPVSKSETSETVPESRIVVCGQEITLKQRLYGMTALACLCFVLQLVAVQASGHWARVEIDTSEFPQHGGRTFYLSYDLWGLYVRDDDEDPDGKDRSDMDPGPLFCGSGDDGSDHHRALADVPGDWCDCSHLDCKNRAENCACAEGVACCDGELIYEHTTAARVTTPLALVLTGFAVLGLLVTGLISAEPPPPVLRKETKEKYLLRFSILLAVGGLVGLVGAAISSSQMAAHVDGRGDKDLYANVEDEGTNTCASGCELSRAAGVISMVAVVAVHLLPKCASAPAGDDISDDIKPSPKSAPEGDIDLCGRKITLKQRFYGMAALGWICVICQLGATLSLGTQGQGGSRGSTPYLMWANVDAYYDGDVSCYMSDGFFEAKYDLWGQYIKGCGWRNKDWGTEKFTQRACEDNTPSGRSNSVDFCKELITATDIARVTTILALLLTTVGTLGLCCCRRSSDARASALRFGGFSIALAVGGLIGLAGAANYSSKIYQALEDLKLKGNGTNNLGPGCALSLFSGLVSMVAGAAAVFLQRKYAIREAPAEAPAAPLAEEEA